MKKHKGDHNVENHKDSKHEAANQSNGIELSLGITDKVTDKVGEPAKDKE